MSTSQGTYALWEEGSPVPDVAGLAHPRGQVDVMVHRADGAYSFLHDNAIVQHGDALFAAWYNCPQWEMAESSCIRGRRSRDSGRSWSETEVIAADADGRGVLYVPVAFLSRRGTLFAFVCNMVGADLVTDCEVLALDPASGRWQSRGFLGAPFLPNCAPVEMGNGSLIMAGRVAPAPGAKPEIPAVAVCGGADMTLWRVVPMIAGDSLPPERFPESTLWADGPDVTAVVRGGSVFVSRDYGSTWRGPERHDLPAESSKLYAGFLSSGQRYLVWNRPDPEAKSRNLLALAVSRPGGTRLAAMWKIRHGFCDALQAGPEWSYPCAVEHDGSLYVIYTSEKRHSVLSIIPLGSLAVEPASKAVAQRERGGAAASPSSSGATQALLERGLETPRLNTAPLPAYAPERLDYGMTIGIERTPGGRLWACWVGGGDSEKGFFVLATSDDDGESWSQARLVIDPHAADIPCSRRTLVGALWADPLGRLWLFFDQSLGYFDGRAGDWCTRCDQPDAAKPVWTEPVRLWHGCTLNKPTVLDNGEWLLPVSLWPRAYVSPPFAGRFAELDGLRMANVLASRDEGRTWLRRGGAAFPDPCFDEHMIVQRRDGSLWMPARTRDGIWESFSFDRGRTWGEPVRSGIGHVCSRFHLRRLRSGRLLLVKHGARVEERTPERTHLTAFLSEDDGATWRGGLTVDERFKVSYPDSTQAPDGTIYLSYDRNRATDGEILMARFTEEDVLAGRCLTPRARLRMLISRPAGQRKA